MRELVHWLILGAGAYWIYTRMTSRVTIPVDQQHPEMTPLPYSEDLAPGDVFHLVGEVSVVKVVALKPPYVDVVYENTDVNTGITTTEDHTLPIQMMVEAIAKRELIRIQV